MLVNGIKNIINQKQIRIAIAVFAYACLLFTLTTSPRLKHKVFDTGTDLLQEIVENINSQGGESFETQFVVCDHVAHTYETLHVLAFLDLSILHTSHFLKVVPFLLSDIPPPFLSAS